MSLDLKESDDKFIVYDFSSDTVSTVRKIKDLTQMLKFTNSVDEFIRLAKVKFEAAQTGIIMTTNQMSELKTKHNIDKL